MDKTQLKDIFFDLDNTLWDFNHNSALTFEHLFLKHKIHLELDRFLKAYRPINERYWKLYRNNKIDREELRFFRLADSFEAAKWDISPAEINVLVADFKTYLPTFNHLLPETKETLEYLNERYNLHILTNGFEVVQQKKLRNTNIQHYFKTVTSSEIAGIKKPHPEIFKIALQTAGASKKNSLMIGDNFEADILGAETFGLKTIYFNPTGKNQGDRMQIKSLDELKRLL